jgi:tetratricopeptide (TPR) repeat protein
VFAETIFPRTHYGWAELSSVLDGKWQYVEAPRPEFFDMEADPGELINLVEKKPDPFRSMKIDLDKRKAAFEPPGPVSEEEKRKLASLGYLSSGNAEGSGPLSDPKDEIGTIGILREAMSRAKRGEPQEAIANFEQLLKKNPRMLDVWDLYSGVLLEVGRVEDALAAKKKTVELAPPAATAPLLSVGYLCLQIGKPEEAIRNGELARDRGDAMAADLLARAWLVKGDLSNAEREARKGTTDPRLRRRSLLLIAQIQARSHRFREALDTVETIFGESKADDVPIGTHLLRGNIFLETNRSSDAEREFQEEIRLHPERNEARVGLALAYASLNRMGDAKRTIAEMVAEVGTVDAYARAVRALTLFQDRAAAESVRREGLRRFPADPRLRTPV